MATAGVRVSTAVVLSMVIHKLSSFSKEYSIFCIKIQTFFFPKILDPHKFKYQNLTP